MKRDPVFKITYSPINLLIQKIDSGDTALPELQRPFVWDNTKVRALFDSLYKGLPIGVIILWKINQNASPSRPIGDISKKYTTPSELIIDGQQRLTALYAVMLGREIIDENYKSKKIKIAFNPFEEIFEVQNSSILKDPIWVSNITDVFQDDPYDFIDEYFERLKEKIPDLSDDEKRRIRRNITSLTTLTAYNISSIELSEKLDLEEISKIFERINSQGTTLNKSDFIFTLMSLYWPEGKNRLENFSKDAKTRTDTLGSDNAINARPTNENLLRTIISYSFLRGRLKYAYLLLSGRNLEEKKTTDEERIKNFEILKEGLEAALDLTNWHDYITIIQSSGFVNENMIRGKNALYQTYALYLLGRCKFNISHMDLESIIRKWFVFSVLTRRYGGSPESVIERELSNFRDSTDLIGVLTEIMDNELTTDYWNITLPPTLESSQASNNNTYNVYKACKAFENENILFTEIKLDKYLDPFIKAPKKQIEHHHIFPKNYLQKVMGLDQKHYNQVANMIYIDYHKNIEIGDKPPHEYWEYILNNKCTSNTKEFIENNYVEVYDLPKNFWNMEYFDFLEARRKLMAKSIHNYFEKL